jgi:hypothetical protein
MKRTVLLLSLFCIGFQILIAQSITQYLVQETPSDTPRILAPGLISKQDRSEFGSIFSTDGSEFFYAVDIDGRAEIRYIRLDNGVWTTPETVIGNGSYSFNDPMLSPDEKKLYYISNMPRNDRKTKDYDIWYSERLSDGWSEPINAGNIINSSKNKYYVSFASNGTMYYSSHKSAKNINSRDYDIYASQEKNGIFQKPTRLSSSINTKSYEADVFIAP